MSDASRLILLGAIAGAHGIRGEVVVRTFTGAPEDIARYGALVDAKGGAPLELKIVRVTDKGVVARVKGVSDRNGAEALKGRQLYVARDQLPATEEGEFYHEDLVGLTAVAADGTVIGRVAAVLNFGAGDILDVVLKDRGKSELVPFTNAFVPSIDLASRTATVNLPQAAAGEDEGTDAPPA